MAQSTVKTAGLVLVLAALLAPVCSAATLTVDRGGGGDFTEIQAAIDAAVNGDTVLIKPGEYLIFEPITYTGKAITVMGESGPSETTIRMSPTPTDPDRSSVVVFESGEARESVLEGVTLTGGQGTKTTAGGTFGGREKVHEYP